MRQQHRRIFPTDRQDGTDIALDTRQTRALRTRLLSGIAIGVLACTSARAQSQTDASATPLTPSVPISGSGAPATTTTKKAVHHRRGTTGAAQAGAPAAGAPIRDNGEVVMVSAQRRNQNLQDVPVSVQVLTGETLRRLNIENFDDMLKYLPNVTASGFGPGQENVYMRGLSIGGDAGGQGGGSVGSFPNVAIYLDDQSAQLPGQNLDIYPVDLQRVEVLEGPQGTLFGSGAEAGVLRYITNKPDLEKYTVTLDGGAGGTAKGGANYNGDVIINMPLIKDKLAVRLVAYNDTRGGYIDNSPGTFVRQSTDLGIHYAGYTHNIPGPATATNSINNRSLVANNINEATYQGIRGEALYQFDDDWNVLFAESAQRLRSQGVFYEEPVTSGSHPEQLSELSVQEFEPSFDDQSFVNTALTINGRIGWLKLTYDGAYLVTKSHQQQDYTNYARGLYADYYQCQPANPAKGFPRAQCYSPGATWSDFQKDTHLSQEIRLSTPTNLRVRATGGFFYENFQVDDVTNFNYLTAPGFTPIGPAPGATVNQTGTRPGDVGFFNDITRGYSQYAIFGSGDVDIIPRVLTATFGTRWFDFHNTEVGTYAGSFGCSVSYTGGAPCTAGAVSLDAKNLKSAEYGFRNRANLTWKITPDLMVYYTYSEGYRPGGFNRRAPTTDHGAFVGAIGYTSDSLTNNEIGYKTQFFNHRLTIDGAFYDELWSNVQDRLFDPGAFGNLAFTVNGPDYRVLGTEVQAVARATENLTFTGGFSLNDTKQLTSPPVTAANGASLPGSVGIFGDVGDTLALSPIFKGNVRARYEFYYRGYEPFFQLGGEYTGHSHSAVSTYNNFYMAPYAEMDVSAGFNRGPLRVEAFCANCTDTRGQQFISAAQFVQSIIVTRPLTAGLKVSYTFK